VNIRPFVDSYSILMALSIFFGVINPIAFCVIATIIF